ncbi:MAG: hypothetical protein ACLP9L_11255 [Thermoguttaceae bacterium]
MLTDIVIFGQRLSDLLAFRVPPNLAFAMVCESPQDGETGQIDGQERYPMK